MQYNQFKWVDTFASDFEAAKQFYSELFGWQFTDQFNEDQLVYSLATLSVPDNPSQGAVVAGVGPCPIPKPGGIPWNWGVYILVENLESTIKGVVEAGGQICKEPMEVMEAGLMAVCADSMGTIFHCGSRWPILVLKSRKFPELFAGSSWFHRMHKWSEAFYKSVFGWTVNETEIDGNSYWWFDWTELLSVVFTPRSKKPGGQELWLPYFQSIDIDSQIETSCRLGGTVVFGPATVPGFGRYAILSDPEYNLLGINQPH